ncbi:TPA: hypothetical protein DCW61_04945 [Candidatus Uhrbacteria bacterium]|nr:hypothetical protein [Candidatus Uhrbacteria bacterium]
MQNVASDSRLNTKTITMDCRGQTSAKAIAKPMVKTFLEQMRFIDKTGTVVRFNVEGPVSEEISGDNLYTFRFVPIKDEASLKI